MTERTIKIITDNFEYEIYLDSLLILFDDTPFGC